MSAVKSNTQEGDLVQLVSPTNKVFLFTLKTGGQFQSHRGTIKHAELIGQPWGALVHTHQGDPYYLIQPSLHTLLMETKRNTQIMFPKDIGYALIMLGIGPGQHVLEAGTGSGALTTALAWMVGPEGRVTSYDNRPEMQNLARRNLERAGLLERVTFVQADILTGFAERDVDAMFLDLTNPYEYLPQAHAALKNGGGIGFILPTTNQIERLLALLHPNGFAVIEVLELMLRFYKAVPARLRPTGRMVAHTGYLIFARKVLANPDRPTLEPDFVDSPDVIDLDE